MCYHSLLISHVLINYFPLLINNEPYLSATQSSFACFIEIGSDVGMYFVQLSTTSTNSNVKGVKKKGKGHQSKVGSPCSPSKVLKRVVSGLEESKRSECEQE